MKESGSDQSTQQQGLLADKGIALATFLVIVGLILSKLTGFMRDLFVGAYFPEQIRESYTMAFYIPDMIYNLLVGGSIQAAITPTLARSIRLNNQNEGYRSISIFISLAAVVMLVTVVFGVVFSDPIYTFIYPDEDKAEIVRIASQASKLLFPQIFFMMLAAFSIGIINAHKRFTATAFGPTIYNVFVLVSILLFAGPSAQALYRTTAGIMGAAAVYFLFQGFVGYQHLRPIRFSLKLKDSGFRKLFKLAIPVLISSSMIQLNMILLSAFAHRFTDNLQFSLRNAFTIWQLPYGIFAVGVGSVMLPSLAGHFASKDAISASRLLSSSLKNALFMTVPMAGLVVMMPQDIIAGAFQWNEYYTDANVRMAAYLLMGYSASIVLHTVIFVFNQAFYAKGKTNVPFFAGLINLSMVFLLCTIFITINPNPRPIYLTLAYSLASFCGMTFLTVYYSRDKAVRPSGLVRFFGQVLLCVALLLLTVWGLNHVPIRLEGKVIQLVWLAARGFLGLLVYILCAIFLKMPEWTAFYGRVRGKLPRRS